METIKLTIPNMKSAHCQMTVTNVVENIGASVKHIAPSAAEIGLQQGMTKDAVIEAIKKAGYKVSE